MSTDDERWQEAAGLRGRYRGWIVIWLATEQEFRAYRRMPGSRRDTALRATSFEQMATRIEEAENTARR